MINKNKSCAIIGLGRMGERYILVAKKLNLKIIGTYDKNIKKNIEVTLKNKLNRRICFSNIDKILNQKPDIIIIASTADSHLEIVEKCAKYGIKKIMVEKPLTNSLENCRKIKKLTQDKKIKICINHANKFSNQYIYLKNTLNLKKFGKIISINYLCGNLGAAMNGTHFFDVFRFITGSEIYKVESNIKIDKNVNPRGSKFKDYEGQISMFNKNGTRGYMDISSQSHHGETLTCICKYGILFMDLLSGNICSNYRKISSRKHASYRYASPYIIERKKIKIDNILTITKINLQKFLNDKNYITLNNGIYPIKILIAAITSSKRKSGKITIKNLKNKDSFSWA